MYNTKKGLRFVVLNIIFLISSLAICQVNDSLTEQPYDSIPHTQMGVDKLNDIGYSLWIKNPMESVLKGDQAYTIAHDLNYQPGMARARRVSGVAHWALGEPKLALEKLTQALELFSSLNNTEGQANCTLNIGMVYADIGERNKARELYKNAITLFESLDLNGRVATTFTKLGMIYLEEGQYPDALNYFTNALKIHDENNFYYGISEAHNKLGDLYLQQENLEQADYHIRQSIINGRKIDDEDGTISNLILMGRLQRKQGNNDLAKMHVEAALNRANKKHLAKYQLSAIQELKEIMRQQNQLDSALYYNDAYLSLRDSIYSLEKSKQIAAIEYGNELKEKNLQLLYLNEKNKSSKTIQWILFVGIWIIALLAFFLIKSLRARNRNQTELLATQRENSKSTIEQQKLKQTELKHELDFKNKELTSYALNFVQKNELLETLQAKINEIKNAKSNDDYKFQLNQLSKLIKQHTNTEKDWEDFRFHFDQVHTDFFLTLKSKFPSLSPNDLKVAALTQLNLSIKETAGILGISPESAKTARYRLRKKLNMQPEDDLYEFLLQLN